MNADEAAERLYAARRAGAKLARLPEKCRPAGVEDAYAVHAALARRLPIGGWKVNGNGRDKPFTRAPLFAETIHSSPAALSGESLPARLFEAELAARITADRPTAGAGLPLCEIVPLVEIVDGRFADFRSVAPAELLADSNASGVIVVGAPLSGPIDPSASERCTVRIDGALPIHFTLGFADPLGKIAWLVDNLARAGLPLHPGDIVTTGSMIAPALVFGRGRFEGERLGAVEVAFD